jgi:hypothetical protein
VLFIGGSMNQTTMGARTGILVVGPGRPEEHPPPADRARAGRDDGPRTMVYRLVRAFNLPRYLANTAMTGLSHAYRVFCVASEGYLEDFARKGVRRDG